MIPAEAQERLRLALARLHPIVMKEILHDCFATLRRAKSRTGKSIPLDLQSPDEAVSKRDGIDQPILDPGGRLDELKQRGRHLTLVAVLDHVHSFLEVLVVGVRCRQITDKKMRLRLLDVATPEDGNAVPLQ